MKNYRKSILALMLAAAFALFAFTGCTQQQPTDSNGQPADISAEETEEDIVVYGEEYSDLLSVSAYLYEWEELPPNFITKEEAQDLGWQSNKGNLWDVCEGASIGGDYFGNREGILPEGESYRECDINYQGGYRGAERLVYSVDDWDIYYTEDHYESFVWVYSYEDGYIMDSQIVLE